MTTHDVVCASCGHDAREHSTPHDGAGGCLHGWSLDYAHRDQWCRCAGFGVADPVDYALPDAGAWHGDPKAHDCAHTTCPGYVVDSMFNDSIACRCACHRRRGCAQRHDDARRRATT